MQVPLAAARSPRSICSVEVLRSVLLAFWLGRAPDGETRIEMFLLSTSQEERKDPLSALARE